MSKVPKQLFHRFVMEMDQLLRHNERIDKRDQCNLLNDLFVLEHQFKELLLSSPAGHEIYVQFMNFILHVKRNILTTRVYFRERQNTFSRQIAPAFHAGAPSTLHEYRINYLFAQWVLERYKGPYKRKLRSIYNKIIALRKLICENNLPLAINRARIFWSKVPGRHLEYMDVVQTASEGLLTAIDKFVPPYRTVWRSVAIGRMTLNMITDSNATLLKFSPKERRILYRASNAVNKQHLTAPDDVAEYVSESFAGVTSSDLNRLILASGATTSIDEPQGSDLALNEKIACTRNLESSVVLGDFMNKLLTLLPNLPPLELKVIRLYYSL